MAIELLMSLSRSKAFVLGIIITITIGLVLGGQCNKSFSVYWAAPEVGLDGKQFDYSMWGGVSKLLEQKSYAIAWLLIIFSGVWPIVKLICLLLVSLEHSFLSNVLSPSRRYMILTNLCQFGRLSFVDVWVVSLIVLTIRINSDSLPGYGVSIWVQAVAEKGSTLFLGAVLTSQCISNTLITMKHIKEFNRRLQNDGTTGEADFGVLPQQEGVDDAQLSVWDLDENDEAEVRDREKMNLKDRFSLFQGIQVQAFIVIWSILVIVALFTPCLFITYTADSQTIGAPEYSFLTGLVTIASNLHPETYVNSPSPIVLTIFGVFLVVIVPLLQLVLVLVIWFRPLCFSVHTTLHLWLDNISHVSSMDTFAVSLLIVSTEVGTLLNKSDLGKFVQVQLRPSGAFAFVFIVALVLSPLVRYILLHHRLFLLEKAAHRMPLLQ